MDITPLMRSMERFPGALSALVQGLSAADARWKPADGAWSVLEVVTHLADEEVEDFRMRVVQEGADEPA